MASAEETIKKKKIDKEAAEAAQDKSTPDPIDPELTQWLVELFTNDEKPEMIKGFIVTGRGGRTEADSVCNASFVGKAPPSHESLVYLSNSIYKNTQNFADALRKTTVSKVQAINLKKGPDPYATRMVVVQPKPVVFDIHAEEDQDPELKKEDILTQRSKIVISDGQFHAAMLQRTMGNIMEMVAGLLQRADRREQELHEAWINVSRELNNAQNNALDREITRERAQLQTKMLSEGLKAGLSLLPGLIKDLTSNQRPSHQVGNQAGNLADQQAPGQVSFAGPSAPPRTPESLAIEKILDPRLGGLADEEKVKIFGIWSANGVCTQPGILTEAQVKIIIGVGREAMPPSELDNLIDGPDQILEAQYEKMVIILGQNGFEKLIPFMLELQKHKHAMDALNAKRLAELTNN